MALVNSNVSINEKELLKAYTKIIQDEEFNNKSKHKYVYVIQSIVASQLVV